jgi:hypothetical protein
VLDPATPTAGHPLGMIDESVAAGKLSPGDRVVASASDAGRLPARVESVAAAVEAELAALADLDRCSRAARAPRRGGRSGRTRRDAPPRRSRRPPGPHLAWFLHLSAAPAIRDAMMLQFGFGPAVGEAAHDDAVASIARATEAGTTIDELVAARTRRRRRRRRVGSPRDGCCWAGRAFAPTVAGYGARSTWMRWAAVQRARRTTGRRRSAWPRGSRGRSAWDRRPGCSSNRPVAADPEHSMADAARGVHRQRHPARLGVHRARRRSASVAGDAVTADQ